MPAADILLSVCGEAPYLGAFLQSLARQDCRDFRLLYRFDGEGLNAPRMLLEAFPNAVEAGTEKHLGIVQSYRTLLKASTAPYVMFADQDDVWHQDKVSVSLNEMRRLPSSIPLLLHGDLRVIDSAGHEIAPSFFRYQALNPACTSLKELLVQNNVTGCTVIINRALAELAEFPPESICHDWILALTAAAFGQIVCMPQTLIDYRQHEGNAVGAVPRSKALLHGLSRSVFHRRVALTQQQAAGFLSLHRESLGECNAALCEAWSGMLKERSSARRLMTALKYGFRKNDWLRTIGMLWAI